MYVTNIFCFVFSFALTVVNEYNIPSPVEKFLSEIPDSELVECNRTSAEQFLSSHPQDESEDAKSFQRKARQIIARAKVYLDELGVPFWLSSGTCLGNLHILLFKYIDELVGLTTIFLDESH